MSKINHIGFGIIMGSLLSLIIIVSVYGNGKEVFCILPSLFGGLISYNYKRKENE